MSKRKLMVFDQVTLDGYFTGEAGDLSWAHASQDAQWQEFTAQNARGDAVFLMGRVTYEMMSSYWPTPQAAKQAPAIAEAMNRNHKVVVSRTLDKPSWKNTTVMKGDLSAEVRRLKDEAGPPILIMGSGTIVCQLTSERLIDEYQLVVYPIAIGKGRSLFEGLHQTAPLRLTGTRTFQNGNVLLYYAPG